MFFKFNSKIIIGALIYIGWIIYYSASSYYDKKDELMKQFDEHLMNAAMSVPFILPDGFHKKNMNEKSVTPSEDEKNRNRLSQLSEIIKIKYIYALIQKDNKIRFTVSSATKEELRTKENISYYFSEYSDAPSEIITALNTSHIKFAQYSDKWGYFRSVFIPLKAPDGSLYLACADIEISDIKSQLRDTLIQNIFHALLFLLFLIPSILAYNRQILLSNKSLQKAKEEIELAHAKLQQHRDMLELTVKERTKELETINHQLNDSIEYASFIQKSFLPNNDLFEQYFLDSFVIWEPKDHVGGDLYLLNKTGGGLFLGVIDCTGHGVPGGFMTMIVGSILKQIKDDDIKNNPALILKILNTEVKKQLGQDKKESLSNDGLDIGLCYIGNNKEIIFSGAKIDLYYIEENTLITIKGDRESLGYRRSKENFDFTNHHIPYKSGRMFYLFSDGVVDQKGGESGYPYSKKRLFALLLQSHSQDCTLQKEKILRSLNEYQNSYHQNDDMTMIGFKI